jgi:hypothetical protein
VRPELGAVEYITAPADPTELPWMIESVRGPLVVTC